MLGLLLLLAQAVNLPDPPRTVEALLATPLDPPRLTCQDTTVPDFSAYYRTAEHLFESAFSAQQRADGEDVRFLEQVVRDIRSPLQVVPAMKMMPDAGARMTAAQRQRLAEAMAAALDRVNGSDREFSASEQVLVASAVPEMHDSQMFVPALRSYIVRHLSAVRCGGAVRGSGLPEVARQFNALISRLAPTTAQLKPITADEVQPRR
ncbi:MAG TPA: hypothetical protein VG456_14665 [Candidatus Sulfopaludibacter sp.]|jgi:hypothetical protein|nr:hypothetical protein [Candidatus Sulfopaludibacter sp.]